MKNQRLLKYSEAINEGTRQAMEISKDVIVLGQLVNSKAGVFGTTKDLVKIFGKTRVRDFPVAESLMTSAALGAAIDGKKVLLVHMRIDFMYYSMDAIVNWLSIWRFKSGGGESSIPVVIRAIIGKGWGQGPQHSKSTHSWFANLPGIRVGIPTNAFDAKGMLIESIFSNDPTILIEHRSLFDLKDYVPFKPYRVKFGKSVIRKKGKDITLVAIGYALVASLAAARILNEKFQIDVEVIDIRSLYPLDKNSIINSVRKTKRLIVVDPSWKSFGASSEIISFVCEKLEGTLKACPQKITYPDSHTPATSHLEKNFYFESNKIISAINKQFKQIK